MLKERLGKRGQANGSLQVSGGSLLTAALIMVAVAVLVSFVNPLSMVIAKQIFLIANYAALGLSCMALILTIVGFFKNQKSWSLVFEIFAIAFFNAAFLFPQGLVSFGVAMFILVWAMIIAGIDIGKQYFKDIHTTLLITQVLLLILQIVVLFLIMTGRLTAS